MSNTDSVKMVRGEIPPKESILFGKLGEMIKSNASYAELFDTRFIPNPRQQELFDICDHHEIPRESDGTLPIMHVQAYGPTGSSKSFGVYAYCLRKLLEYPGTNLLVVRQKLGEVKKSAWKDFKAKLLDAYGIPYKSNENELNIRLPNGSSIQMTSDLSLTPSGSDKADSLGSTAWSFVIFEEADSIRESTAITMAGRMRENVGNFTKIIFYICNPPDEFHWLYRWFFGSMVDCKDPASRYRAIKFEVRDNVKHVGEGYIKSIQEDFGRNRFLSKRLGEGEYGIKPSGTPYFMDSFYYENHVKDLRIEDKAGNLVFRWNRLYPIARGWDPGFRGMSCVVAQEDPELKQFRVFVARLVQNQHLENFLEDIIPELNRMFPGAKWLDFVDTAAKQNTANSPRSSLDIMRDFGLRPRHKPSAISKGLNIINRMLRTTSLGNPRMVFDPWGAKVLIQAFEGGYCANTVGAMDTPKKDGIYDHVMDGFRYMVIHLFDMGDSGDIVVRNDEYVSTTASQWTAVGYGDKLFSQPPGSFQSSRPAVGQTTFRNPYRRR